MNIIEPGCTIGVLGGGQLGRMVALAAKRMGYRIHIFTPEHDSPAAQVADRVVEASYDDQRAIDSFAHEVDVVTFEFENIPASTVAAIEQIKPVRPGGHVLHTTQNRLREKSFLQGAGFPVGEFHAVRSLMELQSAATTCLPGVLKTATCGYDGKGQAKITAASDLGHIWDVISCDEAILERFVDFQCELSVITARNEHGEQVSYEPMMNSHTNHILDVSVCPSGLPEATTKHAMEIAQGVAEKLDLVGLLCVEFFLRRDGQLLINELAPRPHNSGHLTIDAHLFSQFDQHVMAICGLPFGSTRQHQPAAMANILGDCWIHGDPDWSQCLAQPDTYLHLYGKTTAVPGRKMGHITVLANQSELAAELARQARTRIVRARTSVG